MQKEEDRRCNLEKIREQDKDFVTRLLSVSVFRYNLYMDDFIEILLRSVMVQLTETTKKEEIPHITEVLLYIALRIYSSSKYNKREVPKVAITWDYENLPLGKGEDLEQFVNRLKEVLKRNEKVLKRKGFNASVDDSVTTFLFSHQDRINTELTKSVCYIPTPFGRDECDRDN